MAWFERMPKTLQAWLTVGAMIAALAGWAFALGSTRALGALESAPARIDALERNDSTQDRTLRYLMSVDSQRTAVWANVGQTAADVADIKCMLRAQIEGTNAARCLVP